MGHDEQTSVEYIMKTQQLSGASSDNRTRTKWWMFPSEVFWRREGWWVPIEANGNGVECFVPPCAPLYAPAPPPTSPLCPHPHILIHSASPSTLPATPQSIGFVTALCLRWIYAEREAKADPCRWESSGLLGWLEPFLSLYNLSCVS